MKRFKISFQNGDVKNAFADSLNVYQGWVFLYNEGSPTHCYRHDAVSSVEQELDMWGCAQYELSHDMDSESCQLLNRNSPEYDLSSSKTGIRFNIVNGTLVHVHNETHEAP
jgi:hypothetical protein